MAIELSERAAQEVKKIIEEQKLEERKLLQTHGSQIHWNGRLQRIQGMETGQERSLLCTDGHMIIASQEQKKILFLKQFLWLKHRNQTCNMKPNWSRKKRRQQSPNE